MTYLPASGIVYGAGAGRRTYRRFLPAQPEPVTGGASPTVPAAGRLLLGTLVDTSTGLSGESGLESRETDTGRTYDVHLHYYDWGNSLIGAGETSDKAHGRIPQLSWYGPGSTSGSAPYQLGDVVSGIYDTYIAAQARRVRNFQRPIFIRFGEEMNGNWYTGYSGNPTDFVAAYQRIVGIFRANGASNVSWVFAPDADNSKSAFPVMNYYPGDAYIDWVGGDGYANATGWSSFSALWGPLLTATRAVTQKPFMICEMACDTSQNKANWISDMTGWLLANADHYGIKSVCWFDTNTSSSGIDYRVDSDTAAYTAWKVFAGYTLTGGPTAPPAATGATVVADTFTRANGAVGNAETGQAWTATGYTISNGEIAPTGTGTAYAFVDAATADCTVESKVESSTGASLADGILFRYSSTTQHFFFRNTTGQLFRANGGGATNIFTYAVGSLYRDVVRVALSGSTITIYRNGVQIATLTDTANQANTKHGYRTATNTAAAYDDFRVSSP